MADVSLLGRVLWYELLTTDMKKSEAFYSAVVGWTVSPFDGGQQPYDIWKRPDGVQVGGVMTIPQGMNVPPHWGMFVGAPKLEEAVARTEQLGGSALSPVIEVPTVGRMRTMKDPQGAMFSLYEPSSPPTRPEAEAQVGDVAWHELYTTNSETAMTFYTALFGWRPLEAMEMGEMGKYRIFGRAVGTGGGIGGMMDKPAAMAQVPPAWGFYVRVPDVNAGGDRVKANGGSVVNGPMEVPGGDWIVNCMDPQGAAFSLFHKK